MIVVNLGNKVIEGKSLQFLMYIVKDEDDLYEIIIPIPDGYDHTEFAK